MEKIIYVNFLSRFANNVFQYALANIIKEQIGGAIYLSAKNVLNSGKDHKNPKDSIPVEQACIFDIIESNQVLEKEEWTGKFRQDEKDILRKKGVFFAEDIITFDNGKLAISKKYNGEPIILSGYYQDISYYKNYKDFIAGLFKFPNVQNCPGENDIVLHFRGTDLAWAQLPLDYFRWILDQESFNKLWIVTDERTHPVVQKLAEIYPSVIQSDDVIQDFLTIMHAKKIMMTVSTFCWLAGWLSRAEKIYFPIGSLAPLFNNDGDHRLIVDNEPRYQYVKPYFKNRVLKKFFQTYQFVDISKIDD